MDWESIKYFVLFIVGGLLWFAGWFFGKGKPTIKTVDTSEKEKEAAFKEGKAESLEKEASKPISNADKESDKADALMQEADKIREEIEASKEAEKNLPKPVSHDNLTPEQVDDEFNKRGY
jgi:seryl-tRNA synthetase